MRIGCFTVQVDFTNILGLERHVSEWKLHSFCSYKDINMFASREKYTYLLFDNSSDRAPLQLLRVVRFNKSIWESSINHIVSLQYVDSWSSTQQKARHESYWSKSVCHLHNVSLSRRITRSVLCICTVRGGLRLYGILFCTHASARSNASPLLSRFSSRRLFSMLGSDSSQVGVTAGNVRIKKKKSNLDFYFYFMYVR